MLKVEEINSKPQKLEECHAVILILDEQVKLLLENQNKNPTN
jgi:hypothetical protein